MSGDKEDLATEHPVFLEDVIFWEDKDQEGGSADRTKDTRGTDAHQEAAGGAGVRRKGPVGLLN